MSKLTWIVLAISTAALIIIALLVRSFGRATLSDIPALVTLSYQFLLITVVGGGVALLFAEVRRVRQTEGAELAERRERALLLVKQLYDAYGQFYSVWKTWHYKKPPSCPVISALDRAEFVSAAAAAEAQMEAIMVHVAAEIPMTRDEQVELGRLRQGFQQLREKIEVDQRVPWHSSDHPKYLEFKRLSAFLATMLATTDRGKAPSRAAAFEALREITSKTHEAHWD